MHNAVKCNKRFCLVIAKLYCPCTVENGNSLFFKCLGKQNILVPKQNKIGVFVNKHGVLICHKTQINAHIFCTAKQMTVQVVIFFSV